MDKHAKEAAERRMLNALLSILCALVLLFGGLMTGYVSSFGKHYENATEFRDFAYSVFAADGDGRIEFSVENKKMTASKTVDSFADGEYKSDEYALIVDTRPMRTTYDDFSAFCTDKTDKNVKIDYADWRKLDEEQKKNYTFGMEYSGVAIDVAARKDEYTEFLVSDETDDAAKEQLQKLNVRVESGEIDEARYCEELYELYVKNYYPSLSAYEKFGNAPTLRTYYENIVDKEKPKSYLIVFENQLAAAFVNSNGVAVQIDGTYSEANGIAVDNAAPSAQARASVDRLMRAVFDSSTAMNAYVYVINLFTSLPWILIAFVMCAAAVAVTFWLTRAERSVAFHGKKSIGIGGACKIVGMFMFWSGALTFAAAAVMSQFISRSAVYSYSILCLSMIVAARSVAFCIAEGVRAHIKKKRGDDGGEFGAELDGKPDIAENSDGISASETDAFVAGTPIENIAEQKDLTSDE